MPIDFIIIESYKLRFEGTRGFLVFFPTSAGILIVTICKDANVSFLRICWEAGIWLQFLGLCFPSVASLNKPWVGDLGGQTMVETPTCGLLLKRREPRSIQLWFPAQSSKVMQPINAARTGLRERERMEEKKAVTSLKKQRDAHALWKWRFRFLSSLQIMRSPQPHSSCAFLYLS